MSHKFLAVAFVSGMSVMALEITASRVVAPHFGASIFVWTNVIGVIMISLAAGYVLGSRLARMGAGEKALSRMLAGAALFALVAPLAASPLSKFLILDVLSQGSGLLVVFVGSFAAIVILFAVPIVLLGAVGPVVISVLTRQGADAGEVAGRVFAISTAGSLIGTFIPTLVTIPLLGTGATIAIFSGVLILTTFVFLGGKKTALLAPAILIPGLFSTVHANAVLERETPYQYAMVIRRGDEEFLRTNEGIADQSIYRHDTALTGSYWDQMMSLAAISEEPRVLILGLAGGTISRGMAEFFGDRGIRIDGVEIDPTIVEIARDRFELDRSELVVHVEDGRVFLEKTSDRYDLIVIDVYANQVYIPFHMTTVEFWRSVREHLNPDGLVAMNVNAPGPDSKLLRRVASTVAAVFPNAYQARVIDDGWNFLVMGSDQAVDWDKLVRNAPSALAGDARRIGEAAEKIVPSAPPLTDDRAPVELLTDRMIFEALRR
ncbi:hypothetical protein A3F28_03425 [Candidatus Uhrbacteria bacterium RIFCSPHIGHO2_12_FULL_57_11]|uniref:PABS domain-containing protein n=1 Tax=Candidatus Uhrbacteria bacterium RIFCSPHIGHO2_12_FULL_57_11 TaxID=1802398 RepID=A0A1F7UKD2_9BACT|nr:MAG: hypothetical protein A3F28_03425 [Candidatus Uhrbacteria bacterium RIFCSPHIGHO2_12_FULL_57_11]